VVGDTLYIRGGTYNQTVYIGNSGTAGAYITIAGHPGETAIVDGMDTLPADPWGELFSIYGNYVEVRDLTIQNSNWMGLGLRGQYARAIRINSYKNMENGILVTGDYGLVESCNVWWNAKSNEYGKNSRGNWASGLSAARHPHYATLRNNKVWNNWGEGLSTYEAEGTLIEDNVVYDNVVYISDAVNVTFQRNLIYWTGNPAWGFGGISMQDEVYNPPSSEIKILNNLVYGSRGNYYWWQGPQGGGMKNVLIAHNTFVNNSATDNTILISSGPHQNGRFENNVIEQDGSMPVAYVPSGSGLSFSNNLWSKAPPPNASGTGDVIGDPKLAKTGQTGAGLLAPEWFRILSNSPARDHAKVIPEVTEDYFRTARGQSPDIGAHEYVAADIIPPAAPRGLRIQ